LRSSWSGGTIGGMELSDLGFSEWFGQRLRESAGADDRVARVTAASRDSFLVRNEDGEAMAALSGRLAFSAGESGDLPVVGDWVMVRYYNSGELAIISRVLPRRSLLRRKTPGKRFDYQVMAANIDSAFVVQSCDSNFNLRRLERYLVTARDGGVTPVILLSKSDLVSQSDLDGMVSRLKGEEDACAVVTFSNKTGSGLEQVRQALERGKTYCLLGSSGVGKTTLLNQLVGREAFATNTVREKDGKGRHTTARRQLVVLAGGAMMIDTPGMREVGIAAPAESVDGTFDDIGSLAEGCRFNDCTHTSEAGCSVLAALRSGEASEGRYQSYLKLVRESEHYEMTRAEKRRKDRTFGRMVKSVTKNHWKR